MIISQFTRWRESQRAKSEGTGTLWRMYAGAMLCVFRDKSPGSSGKRWKWVISDPECLEPSRFSKGTYPNRNAAKSAAEEAQRKEVNDY
jgi:hypothetical protein